MPGAPPPPTLIVGPSPVAVGTPHIALGDLTLYGAETVSASGQSRHCCDLVRGVTVIKLQDHWIRLPTVNARMVEEVFEEPLFVSVDDILLPASRLGVVVVAVPSVVLFPVGGATRATAGIARDEVAEGIGVPALGACSMRLMWFVHAESVNAPSDTGRFPVLAR